MGYREEGTRRVVCVVGTRPEVVKMAPVVIRLRRSPGIEVRVVSTGQHRELLDVALADFGLVADRDLALMRPGQTLAEVTARALPALDRAIAEEEPDLVLAQGDTTTVLATALASYYRQVPFGHVEAGLRTGRPYQPFPEEKNRVLAGHLAEIHFAPTSLARQNLLREGIDPASIHVTGNTGIDALALVAPRPPVALDGQGGRRLILVTAHRRENFGAPMVEICRALRTLVGRDPGLDVVFPVHPNPAVRSAVFEALQGVAGVHLIEPVGYAEFVGWMKAATLILTDSGGVQEEGPSLGKPVVVLRRETERPESGRLLLVGPDHDRIVDCVEVLLNDPLAYNRLAAASNPYGDGWAAERIARILDARFGLDSMPAPSGFPGIDFAATDG